MIDPSIKVGAKVRITYEDTVREVTALGFKLSEQLGYFPHEGVSSRKVEVVQPAPDGPEDDPIGTVRQAPYGTPYIKSRRANVPWTSLDSMAGDQLSGCRDVTVANWPIIGIVPGSQADKPNLKDPKVVNLQDKEPPRDRQYLSACGEFTWYYHSNAGRGGWAWKSDGYTDDELASWWDVVECYPENFPLTEIVSARA